MLVMITGYVTTALRQVSDRAARLLHAVTLCMEVVQPSACCASHAGAVAHAAAPLGARACTGARCPVPGPAHAGPRSTWRRSLMSSS
jgi:hypothetical protein